MILDVIREITEEKRTAHRFPDYALFVELYRRVGGERRALSTELRELRDAGFIRIGRTVNGAYLQLIEDDL